MSTEEKQNFPTYQDSNSFEYPENEKEVSNFIKKFYKLNIPIEFICVGEDLDDIESFDPNDYVDGLLGLNKDDG